MQYLYFYILEKHSFCIIHIIYIAHHYDNLLSKSEKSTHQNRRNVMHNIRLAFKSA
jgi:hypothetical protein